MWRGGLGLWNATSRNPNALGRDPAGKYQGLEMAPCSSFVFTSHRLVISPLAISWLSRLGGHQMHGWMDAALAPVRCRAGGRQEHGVVAFKIPVAFETARDHL